MRQLSTLARSSTALLLAVTGPMLGGCVVRAAADVAMAPVHAAGWTVDKMTTSQAEADRNRGREMRKQEQRDARERRREQQRQEPDAGAYGS